MGSEVSALLACCCARATAVGVDSDPKCLALKNTVARLLLAYVSNFCSIIRDQGVAGGGVVLGM
eukprot:15232417-Alexandrium_andersonii.AAC.1